MGARTQSRTAAPTRHPRLLPRQPLELLIIHQVFEILQLQPHHGLRSMVYSSEFEVCRAGLGIL